MNKSFKKKEHIKFLDDGYKLYKNHYIKVFYPFKPTNKFYWFKDLKKTNKK